MRNLLTVIFIIFVFTGCAAPSYNAQQTNLNISAYDSDSARKLTREALINFLYSKGQLVTGECGDGMFDSPTLECLIALNMQRGEYIGTRVLDNGKSVLFLHKKGERYAFVSLRVGDNATYSTATYEDGKIRHTLLINDARLCYALTKSEPKVEGNYWNVSYLSNRDSTNGNCKPEPHLMKHVYANKLAGTDYQIGDLPLRFDSEEELTDFVSILLGAFPHLSKRI